MQRGIKLIGRLCRLNQRTGIVLLQLGMISVALLQALHLASTLIAGANQIQNHIKQRCASR